MTSSLFPWSPYIAIAVGLAVALGAFRLWRLWFALTGLAVLLQVVAWMGLFLGSHVAEHGWDADWQFALGAGFVGGLLAALPYTILGSALGGALVRLFRSSRRRGHV
jgi:hypothetical protein